MLYALHHEIKTKIYSDNLINKTFLLINFLTQKKNYKFFSQFYNCQKSQLHYIIWPIVSTQYTIHKTHLCLNYIYSFGLLYIIKLSKIKFWNNLSKMKWSRERWEQRNPVVKPRSFYYCNNQSKMDAHVLPCNPLLPQFSLLSPLHPVFPTHFFYIFSLHSP